MNGEDDPVLSSAFEGVQGQVTEEPAGSLSVLVRDRRGIRRRHTGSLNLHLIASGRRVGRPPLFPDCR